MTEFLFLGYFNKRVHLAPEVQNDVAMDLQVMQVLGHLQF